MKFIENPASCKFLAIHKLMLCDAPGVVSFTGILCYSRETKLRILKIQRTLSNIVIELVPADLYNIVGRFNRWNKIKRQEVYSVRYLRCLFHHIRLLTQPSPYIWIKYFWSNGRTHSPMPKTSSTAFWIRHERY